MNPNSSHVYTRRELLQLSGNAALAGALLPHVSIGATETSAVGTGAIVGDPVAAKIGEKVLRDGGNAIDAAVATALAAGIASPSKCGIGGYGGHAMIALAQGKKTTAIDFDSVAPAAARADMFPLNEQGNVIGNINSAGWLAAGVPGTAAGLELALQRYGTRSVRDLLGPSIQLCEDGVHVVAVKGIDDASRNDPRPEAAQGGKLPPEKQRNLALARMLKTFASRNSFESFYRGDIAETIANAFKKGGGLVTQKDLAAFRAHEAKPLTAEWNGFTLHTSPLPATGLLVLEALSILRTLDWASLNSSERLHAKLEALRIAWADRLRTFGDPEHVDVPVAEFISQEYLARKADEISSALKAARPVPLVVDPNRAGGTTHISAVDRNGNMIAITLTHGGSYGARVSVNELGMVLGHGMSRFDPRPGRPNSVAPGKRPITNMCPTIVTRNGAPVLAVGAAGGTRIPNSVYEVLLNYVGLGAPIETAMSSPRLDANGSLKIGLEKTHSAADEAFFQKLGYTTARVPSAYVSAVELNPTTRAARGLSSGGA